MIMKVAQLLVLWNQLNDREKNAFIEAIRNPNKTLLNSVPDKGWDFTQKHMQVKK